MENQNKPRKTIWWRGRVGEIFFQPLSPPAKRHTSREGWKHERTMRRNMQAISRSLVESAAMIVVYLPMTCLYVVLCLVTHPPRFPALFFPSSLCLDFIVSYSHRPSRPDCVDSAVHYSQISISLST
jgi:hypothetical protein